MTLALPLRDIRQSLFGATDFARVSALPAFSQLSEELVDVILTELGRFTDSVIVPLNTPGDRYGAQLDGGVVTMPPGFRDAYNRFTEGGWAGVAFPEAEGGQALPATLALVVAEAVAFGTLALSTCINLTTGAAKAILAVGTQQQKRHYLPHLVSGKWTGTMCLTEPQAGSDLAAIRATAKPVGDGTFLISGQKIYITFGDHDLTENIAHLVLARLPDAPAGVRGVSMFLVPKYHLDQNGLPSGRNDVCCTRLEEKLGIHASPTAVLTFGDSGACIGTLLGGENQGLPNMFIMMNAARLDVGVQGVGISERACQQALAYAQDRKQGYAAGRKSGQQVAILDHPDVRRMLYTMKSLTSAARAICYATAIAADLARYDADPRRRIWAATRENLLTPIAKAWSTDRANEVTSLCIQIHGGMGFIEETGVAQNMRDARILAIYEGTNGIQAIDLVGRKLLADDGAAMRDFQTEITALAVMLSQSDLEPIAFIGDKLRHAAASLARSVDYLLACEQSCPARAYAVATPFLKLFGNVAGGFYLARGAKAAADSRSAGDAEYMAGQIGIARFFAETFLPETSSLCDAICTHSIAAEPLDPRQFTG